MRRSRAPSNWPGPFFAARSRAGCTTNMFGFDLRQAQGATAHPTAEWISCQLTEAYGWKVAPQYIIRDRDAVYGDVFIRLRAMGILDRPTALRSPWQNGYCERAIGSIRRECLDRVVVFGERHLRHLLRSYRTYYNAARTHLSVNKDAPSPRAVHAVGRVLPTQFLGGLHHLYVRILFPTGTGLHHYYARV
jgi:Integrase core domain